MPQLLARGRMFDVLKAHGAVIVAAMKAAGVEAMFGGDVLVGWPDQRELDELSRGGDPIVALYPTEPARDVSRYRVEIINGTQVWTPAPLVATVTNNVIVFTGTAPAGIHVHTFVGAPLVDVTYTTIAGDTPASVAATVGAAITARALSPNVTTQVAGNALTIDSPSVRCSTGGTGYALKRVGQRDDRFLVVVWAADEDVRGVILDAVQTSIGTQEDDASDIPIGDGTATWTRAAWGPRYKNEGAAGKMLKRGDLAFDAQYDLVKRVPLTQIVGFNVTFENPYSTTVIAEG